MATRRRIVLRTLIPVAAMFALGVMCVCGAFAGKQRRGEYLGVAGLAFAASALVFLEFKIRKLPKPTKLRAVGIFGLILGCCMIAAGVLLGFNLIVPYGIVLAVIGAGFLLRGMWMRSGPEDLDQSVGEEGSRP